MLNCSGLASRAIRRRAGELDPRSRDETLRQTGSRVPREKLVEILAAEFAADDEHDGIVTILTS